MTLPRRREAYISVDIEAAGPIPGEFSMVSLGACLVEAPETTFYAEFCPLNERSDPEALKVAGLSLESLKEVGRDPAEVMAALRDWVDEVAGGRRAVFVGFNASFDWAFVNWYFHVFLGTNPFGIGALDIKAYYMGLSGVTWEESSSTRLPTEFQSSRAQTHNALDDSIAQAEIFRKLLDARQSASK